METTDRFVITINRELGSGGRTIGRKLAERLGVRFYAKAVIVELVKRLELPIDEIERIKAMKHHWFMDLSQTYLERGNLSERFGKIPPVATAANMYKIEKEVLLDIASRESCVIAGRMTCNILKDMPNNFKVFIESPIENRVARVAGEQGISEEEALKVIRKVDAGRETYTKKFARTSRYDSRNYDLVLNVGDLTEDQAVDIILFALDKKRAKAEPSAPQQ